MGRRAGHGGWLPQRAGYILAALLALLAVGVAVVWWLRPGTTAINLAPEGTTPQADPLVEAPTETAAADVVVHVTGAVASPGVITLPAGARVDEAIAAAGGFAADADESLLNRAEVLRDGQQVYVPEVGEVPRAVEGGAGDVQSGPININTASAVQLEELSGIGPALAARIVSYREANGPFTSAEGLLGVSGIGQKKLEGLIEEITW